MCIVAIAWQLFDELPLVLLSNRDEFLQRPTEPLHQWSDQPIYAGRDKQSGGTWLGIHQQVSPAQSAEYYEQNGRWAAVLNFRDGVQASSDERSRGALVTEFLTGTLSPMDFARQIDLQDYAGFNLIIGDTAQAVIVNNRGHAPTPLYSGLHVISNGQPEDSWFKTERLRGRLRQEVLPLIAEDCTPAYWQAAAFNVLSDSTKAPEDKLPVTGVAFEVEQMLSSVYIEPVAFEVEQMLSSVYIEPVAFEVEQMLSSVYIEPVAFGDTETSKPTYGTRTQSILTLRKESDADCIANMISREFGNHNRNH